MTIQSTSILKASTLGVVTTLMLAMTALAQSHDDHANHDMSASSQTVTSDSHDMSKMDHSKMDHSKMDHSMMGHAMTGQGDHAAEMAARATHMVEARGLLVRIDAVQREATILYNSIPEVSWPAAEMIFPVGEINLDGLDVGQSVQFTLHRAADGTLPLVELCPAQGTGIVASLCSRSRDRSSMGHGGMDAVSDTMQDVSPPPEPAPHADHDAHSDHK